MKRDRRPLAGPTVHTAMAEVASLLQGDCTSAVLQYGPDRPDIPGRVAEIDRCTDQRVGRLIERRVRGQQKMVLKNHLVGFGTAQSRANLPERRRPDFSVIVGLTDD